MSDIVVIGSVNMDLVVKASRMPSAGETIAGESLSYIPGGKGANQAVAAARMGATVTMVGCVGSDSFGATLNEKLAEHGVDVSHVRANTDASTGIALIFIDKNGENRIIVVPGANGDVKPDDIRMAEAAIKKARAIVCQFEIPMETVEQAIQVAHRHGVPVIVNPAPATAISSSVLNQVAYLVMNEVETETITGIPITDRDAAYEAAQAVLSQGVGTAIITLGSQGALVASYNGMEHVPGHQVAVVDTTAAGDAFVGALAASLVQGRRLSEATHLANAAGAMTVTRFGAQTSLPSIEDVVAFLASLVENE